MNLALEWRSAPVDHAVVPEPGFGVAMYSQLAERRYTDLLGVSAKDWRQRFFRPDRASIAAHCAVKPRARYTDGSIAVGEQAGKGWRIAYVTEPGAFTPDYFHFLAKHAGAFVPVDRAGLEVDMNGSFVSVHCVRPGRYAFKLPFYASVVNLKTGIREDSLESLDLDMEAGETRWYGLRRKACGNVANVKLLPVTNSNSQLRKRYDGTIGNWQHWYWLRDSNPRCGVRH